MVLRTPETIGRSNDHSPEGGGRFVLVFAQAGFRGMSDHAHISSPTSRCLIE